MTSQKRAGRRRGGVSRRGKATPPPARREKRATNRLARAALLAALTSIAMGSCGGTTPHRPWPGSAATHRGRGPSHLSVASDTAAVPLNLLIAQRDERLVAVTPRGQVVWQLHQSDPGAVFVSRTGRTLVIAEPQADVVVMRRVDSGAVSWFFGRRHHPGSGEERLDDPRTAAQTPSGEVAIADLGNCRVLLIAPGASRPSRILGPRGGCAHARRSLTGPDAALPAPRGDLVVTETGPSRVELYGRRGQLLESAALSDLRAPSDASEFGRHEIIVAERTDPGSIEELDLASGKVLWRYDPRSGSGALDDPDLAAVLPNGDVLAVDSGNDRVVVIDRRSKAIVWQYGHTGTPGRAAGYLDDPLSATLVPVGGR